MATLSRKSVALLFLGGAAIDERDRLGDSVSRAAHVKPWMGRMAEMDIIADTKGFFIADGLGHVGIRDWSRAARTIVEQYQEFDGFVVVHQFGTVPTAAFALSLILGQIGKPVVITGSPLLSAAERAAGVPKLKIATGGEFGARANFINAVQVAVSDVAGVTVVYGSHIYRGETLAGSMTALAGEVLGKIDFGIRFFGQQSKRTSRKVQLHDRFEEQVAVVELLPGVDVQRLAKSMSRTRAVFLSPTEGGVHLQAAIESLLKGLTQKTPIVLYQPNDSFEPAAPVLRVTAPTRSTALLKTMWVLGQTTNLGTMRKLLS
ncbi:MAG: asparaginase [Candidatus Kerfeldbacteria bacterium]|nr:asparaginase [Candidatus Kerfeldbacteria bacterium]